MALFFMSFSRLVGRLKHKFMKMVTSRNVKPVKSDPIRTQMQKIREEHARKQKRDYSHVFRSKSRWDLIRLSCIIMGIEFAYAAETAFVSPILLKIGIEHKHMTMVWGLSPLLGFFLAPFLGSMSDRCQLGLGRRRPLILLLSIGILIGLILVPHGKEIGLFLGDHENDQTSELFFQHTSDESFAQNVSSNHLRDIFNVDINIQNSGENFNDGGISDDGKESTSYKWSILITIIGTILLDFDADTCQTPSRAYLLDVCIPEDHAKGLSTFTIMAGLGGCLGYTLGGINWENTTIGDYLGGNIPTVFTIVTIIFVFSLLCTVTSFREIPLSLMEKDDLLRPVTQTAIKQELEKNKNPSIYIITEIAPMPMIVTKKKSTDSEKASSTNEDDTADDRISLLEYLKSIVIMPKSLRMLCLTNLLCWMGHLCYCLYFTDFVGETVFHGDPTAPYDSDEHKLYEEGVRYGCWGMAIYAFSCVIYSTTIEKLIRLFKAKVVYIGGLLIFSAGMLCLAYWPTKKNVLIFSVTAGIVYATLFILPFLLIAQYHAKGSFKMRKGENVIPNQVRGLGTDIAIINSMLFVAQLIVSLSIGSVISLVGSTSAVIYASCILSICSAIAATKVLYMDL